MKTRVLAGLTAVLLVILMLTLPVTYFYILFLILAVICCYEFMHMLENAGHAPMKKIAYIWTLIYVILLYNAKHGILWDSSMLGGLDFLLAVTLLCMALLTRIVLSKERKHDFVSFAYTLAGCVYSVILLGFAVGLIEMENGKWMLGYLILGAVATDTFAYFTGYFIGKRKILPEISPKKTVEGSIGGYIGCAVIIIAYSFIMKSITGVMLPVWKIVLVALTSGIITQIGDWSASYIKRFFKIKDFGKLIPGHGGLLDRLDSIIFLAPLLYLIFII